jgi:hypothetical protein
VEDYKALDMQEETWDTIYARNGAGGARGMGQDNPRRLEEEYRIYEEAVH